MNLTYFFCGGFAHCRVVELVAMLCINGFFYIVRKIVPLGGFDTISKYISFLLFGYGDWRCFQKSISFFMKRIITFVVNNW